VSGEPEWSIAKKVVKAILKAMEEYKNQFI